MISIDQLTQFGGIVGAIAERLCAGALPRRIPLDDKLFAIKGPISLLALSADGGGGLNGGLGLGDGLAAQLLSVSAFKPMIDKTCTKPVSRQGGTHCTA